LLLSCTADNFRQVNVGNVDIQALAVLRNPEDLRLFCKQTPNSF